MPKAKVTDVLINPAIRSHTERILALQAEERQTRTRLGEIIAAIGAELIAAKDAQHRVEMAGLGYANGKGTYTLRGDCGRLSREGEGKEG